jgi:hypothetical protein
MHPFIQKVVAAFSVIALAAVLVSCGGSGGGGTKDASQAQAKGKGTVGIQLTDKPADPAMFAAIIASIIKVELMGSEENGRVELYSLKSGDDPKEFDLLRLRNESIPLVFKNNVPAGTYCKIRLTLSELELVLVGGEFAYPKLPGNGKLDLVVRDCFDVIDGKVLALQLDMDAGKSIHIIEKGNCTNNPDKCFNFRPVVFVDVIEKDFNSKLVRLDGYITKIYPEVTLLEPPLIESLLLCKALPSQDMDNEGCVKVHFGNDSAFFDNAPFSDDGNNNNDGNDGKPTAIYKLRNYMGEKLTVVGWVKSWASIDNDDDKPDEYYPLLYLEALAAELGDFRMVEGKVDDVNANHDPTNPDDPWFSMCLSDCPQNTDSLDVRFQPGEPGINGTRIVSKSGMLLGPGDIEKFLPVQVDGTPDNGTSPLKAALVIVDKSALDTEQVTGVIQSLDTNSLLLSPDEDTCGATTSSLMVDLINPLDILTVIITEDYSEIVPGGILRVGQTVGMNGSCEFTGNYQTDNVVIVDDQT